MAEAELAARVQARVEDSAAQVGDLVQSALELVAGEPELVEAQVLAVQVVELEAALEPGAALQARVPQGNGSPRLPCSAAARSPEASVTA